MESVKGWGLWYFHCLEFLSLFFWEGGGAEIPILSTDIFYTLHLLLRPLSFMADLKITIMKIQHPSMNYNKLYCALRFYIFSKYT